MIEKKEGVGEDNAFANIKHEFEAQRQQLQEHDECIKKHEEGLEDQLARIETMREILDENSSKKIRRRLIEILCVHAFSIYEWIMLTTNPP